MKNFSFLLFIFCLLSCNYSRKEIEKINKNAETAQTDTTKQNKKVKRSTNNRNSCFCDTNTLMNEATVSCDTTKYSNSSIIYWGYNCNKIWLTLENKNGDKFIIDTVPVEYYNYTYRLGYHLIKEFKSGLLFRSGCPANGPCIYNLIDKNNGKILKEFQQLICIEKLTNELKYEFDFVVYLSENQTHLIIEYLDKKKRLKFPFRDKLTAAVPEQQFNQMTLDNNTLTLSYSSDKNVAKAFKVNLSDKTYLF
ncbi:hypothetical protein D3C87_483830 [compost metagenome]